MAAIIFLHLAIDFFFTTETLVAATDAVSDTKTLMTMNLPYA